MPGPRPSGLPSPHQSTGPPGVPSLRSATSLGKPSALPEKTLRKAVSINSFPHPPNSSSRPPTAQSTHSVTLGKKRVSDVNGTTPAGTTQRTKRPSRVSAAASVNSYRGSETPSLLNGAGTGKSIPVVGNHRNSNAQSSGSSPPHSRSSSAQGSYSTSATTIEDAEDVSRGRSREEADNLVGAKADGKGSAKGKETKGNVIVSVRVRPEPGGHDSSRSEGEWMVDGRRSLVSYRGKEGGDYYYGQTLLRPPFYFS